MISNRCHLSPLKICISLNTPENIERYNCIIKVRSARGQEHDKHVLLLQDVSVAPPIAQLVERRTVES